MLKKSITDIRVKNPTTLPDVPEEKKKMLYTLITLLVVFWLVGLLAHFGGSMIHTLLLIAGVLFVVQLITGRSAV